MSPSRDGPSSTRRIRVGLVGCGEVTRDKHLPALAALREVELVAVADPDRPRREQVADQFRIPHRFPDVRSLLGHEPLDAVGVLVPPGSHADVAFAVLEAGKHVLIEKPLALSLAEADALCEAARGRDVKVMVGFHMRWHRLVRRARAIVQSGALGRLVAIRGTWYSPRQDAELPSWRARREQGGGSLVEIGVHQFDLWRYLLDTEIARVFAVSRHGRRDDECAAVVAELSNNMLASVALSERTSHDIEIEVSGDRGRLRVACQRADGLEILAVHETQGMFLPRLRGLARFLRELPRGLSWMGSGGDYVESYRGEWRHFVGAIRGDTPPECTLLDGRKAMLVALAATESAARGVPVRIDEAPGVVGPARNAGP